MKYFSISAVILLIAIAQYAYCTQHGHLTKDSNLLDALKQKEYEPFNGEDDDDGDAADADAKIENLFAKLKSTRIGQELLRKELDEYIRRKFLGYMLKEYDAVNHNRDTRGFEALGR